LQNLPEPLNYMDEKLQAVYCHPDTLWMNAHASSHVKT
jgi:hypothetical protein